MPFFKTPAVADLLGVTYWRLINLLRSRRLVPPAKDTSGDYVWAEADIERARVVLQSRRRDNDIRLDIEPVQRAALTASHREPRRRTDLGEMTSLALPDSANSLERKEGKAQ
jgi:hypothetical protein